jgi:hypothetical protein
MRQLCHLLGPVLVLATPLAAAENSLESSPMAARSRGPGTTLFHRISPDETGIITQNQYDDPRMWGDRSRGFFYGPLGTGVAIGDYDGDGRPDLLVVSKVEGHRLFRNLGNWRFEDVTAKTGVSAPQDGEWEQGVTWTDINNDGWLDLYVCRSGAANLLYVNQGDGTFREEAARRGLAVKDDSVMAAFWDYDRDGWLDVYLVTNTLDVNHDDGRPDYLFRNNGDGTFTDVTAAAGIGSYPFQGHAAVWWDYDNDGWPDLYVANDFSPPDIFYHNDGNGGFSPNGNRAVPHITNSSMGADTGDLNNDGLIDLMATDMAPTTHEKDQRTMAEPRARLNQPFPDPFDVPQLPRNALFLNTGTGFALEAAELAGLARTDWTWSVRCEDFDNDGRLDLHFTNGMNREQNNVDLTRRIAAAGSQREQIHLMKSSPVLAERNLAFRNLGNLRFEETGAAWGLDEVGVSFGAATGDLDGDGDLDLVYTNYQGGVTVLRNDSDQGNRVVFHLRGTRSNRFGIGATVRIETDNLVQIRQLALARGYMSSSEPIAHFGLGTASRIQRVTVTWPSGHEQVLTNLAVNQRYTVTEPDTPPPVASVAATKRTQFREISRFAGLTQTAREIYLNEERIQPLLPRTFNRAGPALAVGDLDGDGVDDICLGGTTEDSLRLLLADRQGGYRESTALTAFHNPAVNDGPLLILDVNGDDRNDLLVTAGGLAVPRGSPAYHPRLLINQGDGSFATAPASTLPTFDGPVGAAVAADYDRDGRLDLFLGGRLQPGAYPEAPRSALLHNRGGAFEDVTASLAPGLAQVGNVTSALWTDMDDDGWSDLLVATEWGLVRCFRNEEGRGFRENTVEAGFDRAGHGLWSSLVAADFNGDGRLDYVAGNLGLNTPYHPTPTEPLVLLRGRFLGQPESQTVEGYYQMGRLYPRLPRGEMGVAFPSILRRFAQNNAYARATLAEILGEQDLAAAARFTVTELRSGVFLSQSDGSFVFTPLPPLAQIAPLQGVAAGDFNGDGRADLIAAQNSYSFNQTLGRFDGGLGMFLQGDGHGGFRWVPPTESGLLLPGDNRALALINFDGDSWPDLLVTRNRSPTLAWQNRGASGRQTLQVRLRAAAGNRPAIGALVTAEFADGTVQATEVAAGGGVLSQGTTTLWFGYTPGNRPRRLLVRWPSGVRLAYDLPEEIPALLEFAAP